MKSKSLSIVLFCSALSACTASEDTSGSVQSVSAVAEVCIAAAPEIPYNLDIQCGESLVPMLAAFNEKTEGQVAFAPHPDATGGCPFLVQGATIAADAVENCLEIVATAAHANTEGSKDLGKDRVEVSWCWHTDSGVECESDHMTIRYFCDEDSEASEHDSSWPLHGSDCEAYPETPDSETPETDTPETSETPETPETDTPETPDTSDTPETAPECVQPSDCATGEFCERGTCRRLIG